jgi:hypothetical protein
MYSNFLGIKDPYIIEHEEYVECNLTGKKKSVVQTNFVSKKHQIYTVEKHIKDVISCEDRKRIHTLGETTTLPHGYDLV